MALPETTRCAVILALHEISITLTVFHEFSLHVQPWQEEIPNAAADDEDANDDDEEDAMTMLEKSQAASKRQMEEEDNLADLR
jgi:hypothetical protein